MNLNIAILLILSALLGGSLSYFQYFYKQERNNSLILPAVLRFISLFALLTLLINPRYEARQYTTVKPNLQVVLDGSKSMRLSGGDSSASDLVEKLRSNPDLNSRFDLDFFHLRQQSAPFGFDKLFRLPD